MTRRIARRRVGGRGHGSAGARERVGTTNPSPNAPATPLLLGTDNQPVNPGADELPRTGPARELLPLGTTGAAPLAAGTAGLWWSSRRPRWQEG
ncbi:hypothetical protein GCM10027073_60360 [Streptomyces chlorus]